MLLLDTNILISRDDIYLEPTEKVTASILSRSELEVGIQIAEDPDEREERLEILRDWDALIEWQPYTIADTRSYGILAAAAFRAGSKKNARSVDMHIAAQAYTLGAGLLTLNTADYQSIRELVSIKKPRFIETPRWPNAEA